jgi:amino acid efflux transporter
MAKSAAELSGQLGEGEHKTVTVLGATALYVASVLGGGILVLPGLTAATAGPGSLIAWGIVSVLCLPMAMMFAQLSAMMPDAGGVSTFVRQAMGNTTGDLTGWLYLWVIPFGQSAVMLSGLRYVHYAVPLPHWLIFVLAWAILCSAGLLNITGTRLSVRAQAVVTGSIVVLLALTVALSVPHMHAASFHPVLPYGWRAVGLAATLIMWAYVGWENVSSIAEDFRNPKRDFAVSVILSVIIVGGLYTAVTAAVIGVVPRGEMTSATAPLGTVLSLAAGPWAARGAAVISIMIIVGSAMAIVWGLSGLAASLARTGSLPRVFAKRNSRGSFRNSVLMILVAYTLALLVMYMGWVSISTAARFVGGSAIIIYGLCAIAHLRLVRPLRLRTLLPPGATAIFVIALIPFFGSALLYQLGIVAVYLLITVSRKGVIHATQ